MSYQPGVPTGIVPLLQDYLNIQGNFTSLNNQWIVDHVPLTSNAVPPSQPNGYHTNIHMVPFSTTTSNPPNNSPPIIPTASGGYGQLWSAQINDGVNPDESLFFLTGGNRNIQLTRNFVPQAANNGFTFLPGGIIMQWGIKASAGGLVTVTLPMAFPANYFSSIATIISNTSSTVGIYAVTSPTSGSVSSIQFTDTLITPHTFFWWALGN